MWVMVELGSDFEKRGTCWLGLGDGRIWMNGEVCEMGIDLYWSGIRAEVGKEVRV